MTRPTIPPPDEPMAVARKFVADRFTSPEGVILLRRWRGGWWHWERSCWRADEDPEIRADVYRFTEDAVYLVEPKEGLTEKWSPNRYKITDLLDALGGVCLLRGRVTVPSWLEPVDASAALELVSVGNGLLHVVTRELLPHDPRLFNTTAVPFFYDPDAPSPTRWLRFLGELWPGDPDSIAALQEWFGYVISGRTNLHKIVLLIGPTRAGKGVIARILKALVGVENCAGPSLSSLSTNFGLQPLISKPLAIVADARLGGPNTPQVVENLLRISGEDMVSADVKYRDHWTGNLPTRFVLISNELPHFGDASGAIANRFVVLSLTQSFLGRENPDLTDELLEELPGILNWSLDGLARLTETNRFTEPASSRDAALALQDLASPVGAFVRDRCERRGTVLCDVLFQAWKKWAEDNGHPPGSLQKFARNLRAAVSGLQTTQPRENGKQARRWYTGICLRDTEPESSWPTDTRDTRIVPLLAQGEAADRGAHPVDPPKTTETDDDLVTFTPFGDPQ